MKRLSNLFWALALVLSHWSCASAAWSYRDMLCGIRHSCCSAPAWVALLPLIPYGLGIALCAGLGWYLRKKEK